MARRPSLLLVRSAWSLPLVAGLLGAWLTGCQGTGGTAARGRASSNSYMVARDHSPFFKLGPAQAFGPDQQLSMGDRVTLVQRQYGYSRVLLASGTSGFVQTEDITPAPPPPVTRPPATAALGGTSRKRSESSSPGRNSRVAPTAGDPLFDINDLPAPLPQDPVSPTSKSPTFRY